jgi:hypothetical protein
MNMQMELCQYQLAAISLDLPSLIGSRGFICGNPYSNMAYQTHGQMIEENNDCTDSNNSSDNSSNVSSDGNNKRAAMDLKLRRQRRRNDIRRETTAGNCAKIFLLVNVAKMETIAKIYLFLFVIFVKKTERPPKICHFNPCKPAVFE